MINKAAVLRSMAALAVTLSMAALAADVAEKPPVIATSPMHMIWGLLFLLGLVGGGWWLIRRTGGLQINSSGMKVIAAISVGPRERVVLIELAGEQWLLGVAPGCVNLLHRFDQPVVAASTSDFGEKIRQLMQQGLGK